MQAALLQKLFSEFAAQLNKGNIKPSRKRVRSESDEECPPAKRARSFTKSNLNDVLRALLKEDLVLMFNAIATDGYVGKKNKDQLKKEVAGYITSLAVLKRGLVALYKDNLIACVDAIGESWSRMTKDDAISYIVDYCK